jgi:hypothetical protein
MKIEVGKTYRDEQSKCDITVLREYLKEGKVFIKVSNRAYPEVIKRRIVEKSVTREVK